MQGYETVSGLTKFLCVPCGNRFLSDDTMWPLRMLPHQHSRQPVVTHKAVNVTSLEPDETIPPWMSALPS